MSASDPGLQFYFWRENWNLTVGVECSNFRCIYCTLELVLRWWDKVDSWGPSGGKTTGGFVDAGCVRGKGVNSGRV